MGETISKFLYLPTVQKGQRDHSMMKKKDYHQTWSGWRITYWSWTEPETRKPKVPWG